MDRWQWAKRASWAVLALGSAAAASSVLLSGEPKSDSATRSWRLLHKKEVTEDLGYFYFTAPRRHPAAPSAAVGERAWRHMVFQEPTVSIVRAYSLLPCSLLFPEVTASEEKEESACFMIKRYRDGPMSRYIHALRPRHHLLRASGPFNTLPSDVVERITSDYDRLVLIGGGTGVAPFLHFLHAQRSLPAHARYKGQVHLLFASHQEKEANAVQALAQQVQNKASFRTVTGRWLTREDVMPPVAHERTLYLLCGPPGLTAHLVGDRWRDFGVLKNALPRPSPLIKPGGLLGSYTLQEGDDILVMTDTPDLYNGSIK